MQDKKITVDDISRGIDTGLNTADGQRAATLEQLQSVRQAKAMSLRREQARLTLKYGADHPRVQALAASAEHNQGLLHDLVIETTRARTEIPSVEELGWVLHGYVRDRKGNGLPELTVALYDDGARTANWLRALGYACTNDEGYFKLEVRDLKDNAGEPAFLRVLNAQGATLYMAAQGLTLEPGQVEYREIIIGGETTACAPPSSSPRASADAWIVRGNVSDNAGAALPGLTMSIADRAREYADRLGKTKTGAKGEFEFTYKSGDFADLIKQPVDLFLQVLDANQRPLYTHNPALQFAAGKIDDIPIVLGNKPTIGDTGKSPAQTKRRSK